jgi:hypothetical protein
MPFQPGQSGNPAGRPPGARNRRTIVSAAMLEGEADALVRRAIDQGLDGDLRAIRLILDRLEPAPKDRPIDFEMPPVAKAQDSIAAFGAISSAVAKGELTPLEAKALSTHLDCQVRAIERATFEERLEKLEKQSEAEKGSGM